MHFDLAPLRELMTTWRSFAQLRGKQKFPASPAILLFDDSVLQYVPRIGVYYLYIFELCHGSFLPIQPVLQIGSPSWLSGKAYH
jgi:hypothetical protein